MEGGINLQGLRKCLHWCNVPYSAYICEKCPYREHGLYDCVEKAMRDADKLLEKLSADGRGAVEIKRGGGENENDK